MLRYIKKTLHTWLEILVRIGLIFSFIKLESVEPFKRKILPDEIWIYRYPIKPSYVPVTILWPLVTVLPTFVFILFNICTKQSKDLKAAVLGHTLSFGLNGVLVDIIKITVGRPRPDFFYRCFPDGIMNSEMICTGEYWTVQDGRKSFPSGHSSFSFATMGFLSFYLMGKLKIFSEEGRGKSYRLIFCFLPMILAMLIAISRTMDYHHWKEDVGIGSLIGLLIAYMCYRQYYPPLTCKKSNLSYEILQQMSGSNEDLIEKEIKWI
ncbi:CLUMA_CG018702, isoform A [Clunio marinus]|uniref:CLUMA_CG018702, isoform A n=1 Tax=Clunio marinus TaxID=568069 RepID=A0A1J1IZN8_9DIPT|nr:CLUMA_CG018702, isoform A [Clunio marinus]